MDIKGIRMVIKNAQRDLDEMNALMASGGSVDREYFQKKSDELFDAREVLAMYNKLPEDQRKEDLDVTDMLAQVKKDRSQENWDKFKRGAVTRGKAVGRGVFGFIANMAGWAHDACLDAKGQTQAK